MPRKVTLTFSDGSNHVYENVPDTVTPDEVEARAAADFPDYTLTNIDGGRGLGERMVRSAGLIVNNMFRQTPEFADPRTHLDPQGVAQGSVTDAQVAKAADTLGVPRPVDTPSLDQGFAQASQQLRKSQDQESYASLVRAVQARTGADTETAQNILVQAGIARQTMGDEAAGEVLYQRGGVSPSTFDFETSAEYRDANPFVRGAAKGGALLKNQALGLHQAAADLVGAEGYGAAMQAGRTENNRRLEAIGERGDAFQRNLEGAVSSLTSQGPALFAGVLTGSEAIPLMAMGAQVFGDEYAAGIAAGHGGVAATGRAGVMGAAEILGEKLGLGNTLRGLRAIGDIGSKTSTEVANTFAEEMLKGMAKEIPGEQLTTALQFLTDKIPNFGLNPQAGLADYLQQAGDTLAQTVLQSGMMIGGGSGIVHANRLASNSTSADATLDANAAKARAMDAWAGGLGARPAGMPQPSAPAATPAATSVAPPTADAAAAFDAAMSATTIDETVQHLTSAALDSTPLVDTVAPALQRAMTALNEDQGVADATQVDATGNPGTGIDLPGSRGNAPALPVVGRGGSADAGASVGRDGTPAPVGAGSGAWSSLSRPITAYHVRELLYLSTRHPDDTVRDMASAELKRRETEFAYQQAEQQKSAQTDQVRRDALAQTADAAPAVAIAQGVDADTPTAMQLAMQRAQARQTQAPAAAVPAPAPSGYDFTKRSEKALRTMAKAANPAIRAEIEAELARRASSGVPESGSGVSQNTEQPNAGTAVVPERTGNVPSAEPQASPSKVVPLPVARRPESGSADVRGGAPVVPAPAGQSGPAQGAGSVPAVPAAEGERALSDATRSDEPARQPLAVGAPSASQPKPETAAQPVPDNGSVSPAEESETQPALPITGETQAAADGRDQANNRGEFEQQPDGTVRVRGFTKEEVRAAADKIGARVIVGNNGSAVFAKGTDVQSIKDALVGAAPATAADSASAEAKSPAVLARSGLQSPEANTIQRLNPSVVTDTDAVKATDTSRSQAPRKHRTNENGPAPAATRHQGTASVADSAKGREPNLPSDADVVNRDGSRYSRPSGDGQTSIDGVRARLTDEIGEEAVAALEEAGRLKIVTARQAERMVGEAPEAWYKNGTAYLVADQLRPGRIVPVILHEIGEHHALEEMLGAKEYGRLQERIRLLRSGGNPEVQMVWDRVKRLYPELEEGSDTFTKEVIAKLGEYPEVRERSWWKDLLTKLRAWLTEKGFGDLARAADLDIHELLRAGVARTVAEAKKAAPDLQPAAAYSREAGQSRTPDMTAVVRAWQEIAQDDAVFQSPISTSKAMGDIAMDNGLTIQRLHRAGQGYRDSAKDQWVMFTQDGGKVFVYDFGKEVQIDASGLKSGSSRGSVVYHAVANYAYNNGKIFEGDAAGFSGMAMFRRLEHMISSALKFGTTDHLRPHPDQVRPKPELARKFGFSGVQWATGDTGHNLAEMLRESYNVITRLLPELNDVRLTEYGDFERISDGELVTDHDFAELAQRAQERSQAKSDAPLNGGTPVGAATAKRMAITASLWASVQDGRQGDGESLIGALRSAGRDQVRGILYSRGEFRGPVWDSPVVTQTDDVIHALQDRHIDMKRVVGEIKATVGKIDDQYDPYLQEELFHGRAAKLVKDFLNEELNVLTRKLKELDIDPADFETFLWARHAPERNAQIAKINPDMPDGGSGLTTAQALALIGGKDVTLSGGDIVKGVDQGKRSEYPALANMVDAMTRKTNALLVKYGIESKETVDAWQSAYHHYVPLHRADMENFSTPGTGQGYSVRGSSSKRAIGSKRRVENILANIALQRERAIVRGEKNRVAMSVMGLSFMAPNKDFWMTIQPSDNPAEVQAALERLGINPADAINAVQPPTERYVDKRTGLVASRTSTAFRSLPNTLVARVSGEDWYLVFNAENPRALRMVESLKNLDVDQMGWAMGQVARGTRYIASVNTQYNPIFGVTNVTRDVQGAMLNLTSTELTNRKKDVAKGTIPAMRGIYSALRAAREGRKAEGVYAELWENFQKHGGQTGYRDQYVNATERANAIARDIKKMDQSLPMAGIRVTMDWLSDYNETLENAVRLSAYKVALDNGISADRAASIAKNLTVNFNRKGSKAAQVGALYAFFNANVQGTARMYQTLTGPKGNRIIAGGLLLGVVQALALAAAGLDDDDVPEFIRQRNIVIPLGGKRYLAIPMPLGFLVIPNLARIPAEWVMGGFRNPARRIADMASLFFDTFNPIGGGTFLQTVSPTLADLPAAIAENKDWTGRPIAKESFGSRDKSPGYLNAKDTASWFGKSTAEIMNYLSGGSAYTPGLMSPTPDQVDYVIGFATGGVGREALKVFEAAEAVYDGEAVLPHKRPLIGKFYGNADNPSTERSRYYRNLDMLGTHYQEMAGRLKDGEDIDQYLKEHPAADLAEDAKNVRKYVSNLLKEQRLEKANGASKEQLKEYDDEINAAMKELNDAVKEVETRAGR